MWIYTKHGFFSIVQDKDDEDFLIVRARVKGDLEFLIKTPEAGEPEFPIEETTDSDYRYRIRMDRDSASWLLAMAVEDINYTNFKAAAGMVDPRRKQYYGMVWSIMCDMQDNLSEPE